MDDSTFIAMTGFKLSEILDLWTIIKGKYHEYGLKTTTVHIADGRRLYIVLITRQDLPMTFNSLKITLLIRRNFRQNMIRKGRWRYPDEWLMIGG